MWLDGPHRKYLPGRIPRWTTRAISRLLLRDCSERPDDRRARSERVREIEEWGATPDRKFDHCGRNEALDGRSTSTYRKSGKRVVTIVRDTGCNTVFVRRSLIADEDHTGTSKAVYLVNGTVKVLPEARLSMRTPFFSGEVTTLCMESPLYDIILGCILGVLAAGEPNPEWDVEAGDDGITAEADKREEVESTVSAAVETRLQRKSRQTA
ncbi:unnamed protein product [Ixodes pacificus]